MAKNKNEAQEPLEPYNTQPLNFDKVWLMFQETSRLFREGERDSKELKERVDRTFQQLEKNDKKFDKIYGQFTSQWGKLVEAMVEPSCLRLFKKRGLEIEQSYRNVRIRRKGEEMELDVLLVDTTELVVVEVKTTCKNEMITEFLEKLQRFKEFFPQYANYKVYGAVAAITFDSSCDKQAYRAGLYVIKATGEGVVDIVNDKGFAPRSF